MIAIIVSIVVIWIVSSLFLVYCICKNRQTVNKLQDKYISTDDLMLWRDEYERG